MPFWRYTYEAKPIQLKPVLGLLPVAVYWYPRYFIAVATIWAPETLWAGERLVELAEAAGGE
jgi:hypothetical protein